MLTALFGISQLTSAHEEKPQYILSPDSLYTGDPLIIINKNYWFNDSIFILVSPQNNIIIEDRQDSIFIKYYYPHTGPIYKAWREGDWLYPQPQIETQK